MESAAARSFRKPMAIDVETKDTTALSDAELAEMADICVEGRQATTSASSPR